ncbi:carbohydrate ABC transporter permease [Klebsiella pneumoniae]|nr:MULTISPECIES: sugar ABC transporter permease [Enterobacteriaceae]AOV15635.1 ABC transporter permease [Klebsiella sp. LTGPAF-6F]ELD2092653.1 sugar ABC transporter permease [Enterobacter hormaechei]ELJ6259115.1 sugar ABC transporter permease [Klebsiella michiganensis]MBO2808790.1 sugar ABC transporter permease [Enterobacter hormaechei]MBO2935546.1 sugar ABC transporter permease [Enterobacter sichuanensis]
MKHSSEPLLAKGSCLSKAPTGAGPARKNKRSLQQRRSRAAWLLVAPALILLASVAGWPLLRTLFYSFTDAALDTPGEYNLVGFDNYLSWADGESYGVLADPLWWRAVLNTLWFTAVSVSLELFFGMLLALLMNQKFRGQGIVRAAILVPWAIPTIVTAKMWGWMFHDQYGVINDLLTHLGIIHSPLAWIAEPTLSMWAVVIADVWKTIPFMALMLLAALQMIPADLYEAGRVDGATAWQRFTRITLPLIKPAMIVALIFRVMDALRVFDLIYVLTSNSEATISISGYARDRMVSYQEMGSGSASSVLVFMMVAGIAACFLYIGRMNHGDTEDK